MIRIFYGFPMFSGLLQLEFLDVSAVPAFAGNVDSGGSSP